MKRILSLTSFLLAFAGPGALSAADVNTCDQDTYPLFKALATAAHEAAGSVGGQWWKVSIPKPLEEADKSAASGDFQRACEIVLQVEYEGRAGYVQVINQRDAGPRF